MWAFNCAGYGCLTSLLFSGQLYTHALIDKRWEENAATVKFYSIMDEVFILFKIKIVEAGMALIM